MSAMESPQHHPHRPPASDDRGADLSAYPPRPKLLPAGEFTAGRYTARFARGPEELDAVLRLRFEVFNLEMDEGLEQSFQTGRDLDPFDPHCHHMLVVDQVDGRVVGTYRMQTNEMAAHGGGFYSDGEFDLSALPEEILTDSIEVGRACIQREHRNRQALFLLWRGLAAYVVATGKRFFFGCSSINSQDPDEGMALHRQLEAAGQVHPGFSVPVRDHLVCEPQAPWPVDRLVEVPALFRTYLRYGSQVCSGPAIDRDFGTIDFLVLLDTHTLSERSRQIFFAD